MVPTTAKQLCSKQRGSHWEHLVELTDDILWRSLLGILLLGVLASAVFLTFPELDITISKLFFDGTEFPLANDPLLGLLRRVTTMASGTLLIACIALLASKRLRDSVRVSRRDALLPIMTYTIGVGFVVHQLMKEQFGRARPHQIVEFGGEAPFTPAWTLSEACLSNCSFTSGEAAGAMALISGVVLCPASIRRIAMPAVFGLAVTLGMNRVLFGGHFLSDVILSMLIISAIMIGLRIAMNTLAPSTKKNLLSCEDGSRRQS
ncbi:phosphatase PAP2 family protein [Paracoccus saliphilus]|uniref:Membrane-associated enzyme, PAP2 (Acid phosphatase) superfamily n=1 Tax=Paracoccus saliphilus TaxID=405559 RepID=A0AA45W7E0_9RHOB|nr:phosphatase PAP2 family protein [Paracoccus saliphilus]WCR02746.1 phosphatase PAP2 family protein [Paracoccus saliphilus]SIT08911.1 Membrane-associated enzyme, PAP2 (acid phosphatase) superfamily [Paracoccus saliphilus]